MLKFKDWLLTENTISQLLGKENKPKIDYYLKFLSNFPWARDIPKDRFLPLAKWMTYFDKQHNIIILLYAIADYIAYTLKNDYNNIKAKLNNPQYTPKELREDSDKWHESLLNDKRRQVTPGRPLNLPGMPVDWKWVSLDKAYCEKEGRAMGHCGNSGFREGDNIYSLRDKENIPHLTFIVNNGVLGESKGYGNSKPANKYHPMILALLLGKDNGKDIVNYIGGGGHDPNNNFELKDLSTEELQKLLKLKPSLNDFSLFINTKNDQEKKNYIENILYNPIEKVVGNYIVIKSWDNIFDMLEYLKDKTDSNLRELPDLDEPIDVYDISSRDALEDFENYANSENENLADELNDDEEEYDKEILDILTRASYVARESGISGDMYKHVFNSFTNQENNKGFRLIEENNKWELIISLNDFAKLINDNPEQLYYHLNFRYDAPHYGYDGFDKEAYNEFLKDELLEYKERK